MENTILFQQGTMQLLSEGLLDGTMTVKELLVHGNTGIGTGEGIDGELIVLNGKGIKITHEGRGIEVDDSFTVAFADVHFSQYEKVEQVTSSDLEVCLEQVKEKIQGKNIFFSVKIYGEFETIHTRSAKKSTKPYPDLNEIARNQVEFYGKNVTGTLLSYYAPLLYQGITVAGFHSHFISDDHTLGGHVIGAKIRKGTIYVQKFATFTQHNPIQNRDYVKADLSDIKKLDDIIKTSE